jgi:hypothetical protein
MLRPMPVPPPVMSAVLFLRFSIFFVFVLLAGVLPRVATRGYGMFRPLGEARSGTSRLQAAKLKIIPSRWDNQYIY